MATAAGPQSEMAQLLAMVNTLQTQVTELRKQSSLQTTPVSTFVKPMKPDRYRGEQQVLAWCFKLERYFHAAYVTSEVDKCNLAFTLMEGVATNW